MTTKMVAAYYGVPTLTINSVINRNKEELLSDGIEVMKGSEVIKCLIQNAQDTERVMNGFHIKGTNITISVARTTIFPKRAVLRIGMLLRDSEVAKEVRTQLLNVVKRLDNKLFLMV